MKKKLLILLTGVCLTGALAAGCAKKESAPAPTTAESSTAAEETSAETAAPDESETSSEAAESSEGEEITADVTKGTVSAKAPADGADDEALGAYGVEAMKSAHFKGLEDKTVDEILKANSAGEWHGIVSNQGEICVFYETEDESTAINFVVNLDGTFVLTDISSGEEMLEGDGAVAFLNDMVKKASK